MFIRRIAQRAGAVALWVIALSVATVGAAQARTCVDCGCRVGDPQVLDAPDTPLTVTFFGVSTLMFSDGRDRLLVDGFFTRPNTWKSVFGLQSNPDVVRKALEPGSPPVRAVLTAHAQHDHALDTATVADVEKSAIVVGTPSVINLMTRQRVAQDRLCAPMDGGVLIFGAFRVTAFYVDHGPALPILGAILDRPMDTDGDPPRWIGGYTDDRNLSFLVEHGDRRILVHPSAGTRDLTDLRADTVFLGVGRLSAMQDQSADRYLAATVGASARLVVPIHWDAFTTALNAPLEWTPRPLDDIERGFQLVCELAPTRPDVTFLLMNGGARLRLGRRTGFAVETGAARPLCPPH